MKPRHSLLLAPLALLLAMLSGCATEYEHRERREDRERERQARREREHEEIRTVRRRLVVMRYAVEAFLEIGNREAAAEVERAMHARELAIEGDRSEEARAIRSRAPNRGHLAELLGAASNLYKAWRRPERAQELADLSDVYAEQWRRQQRAEREPEGRRRDGDLENREHRVEILRLARAAHAEADNRRAVRRMDRILDLAEMQLEGASDEAIARAAQGLNQGMIIELVAGASRLYADRDAPDRADMCRRLVEYYERRGDGREGGDGHAGRDDRDARIRELEQKIERLERELRRTQELLRRRSR